MMSWQELIGFLWCISKIHLNDREEAFVCRFVKRNIPWESLGTLAAMQGVAGLLYYHLKRLDLLSSLPQPFTKQIENDYHRNKIYGYAVEAEAGALSLNLEEAGISVLALQGLSILNIYGDYGLRPLSDIDLMVKGGQKERLKALLMKAGYRNLIAVYPDILHKDGISIDIHTHILNVDRIRSRRYLFPEDLTLMWEKASTLFKNSNGLLVLDPYDSFIALAAHALKHSYSRMIWLSDLYEFLLRLLNYNDGWETIVIRAKCWRQEKIVLYSLILLEGFFDLRIPFRVKRDLGITRLGILEKYLINLKLKGFSSKELCIPLWLCNIKGTWKKLKFIKETIFPRSDIMLQLSSDNYRKPGRYAYLKRIVDATALMIRNLHQVLIFLFNRLSHREGRHR
jgi:hypothetical protein